MNNLDTRVIAIEEKLNNLLARVGNIQDYAVALKTQKDVAVTSPPPPLDEVNTRMQNLLSESTNEQSVPVERPVSDDDDDIVEEPASPSPEEPEPVPPLPEEPEPVPPSPEEEPQPEPVPASPEVENETN